MTSRHEGPRSVPTCFAYLRIRGGAFERAHPDGATEFDCDPTYAIELSSDFGGGAQSASVPDRESMSD